MIKWLVLKVFDFYKRCIFYTNIPNAVDMASYYVYLIFKYSLPIYNVSDIESHFIRKITPYFVKKEFGFDKSNNKTLFVVSRPSLTGGHTRLMENLSLMLEEKSDLLITRDFDERLEKKLANYFDKVEICKRKHSEDSLTHIEKLFNILKKYNNLILNINPDDLSVVLACGMLKKENSKVKVFFINHADHVASFGAVVADVWYEISLYGRDLDSKRGLRGVKSFLGIPINKTDDCFFRPILYPTLPSVNKFFTGGSSWKYKSLQGKSMAPLLKRLLSLSSNFDVTIIGPSARRNFWLWCLCLRYKKRIDTFPSLPYEQYLEVTEKSDYYIDSYPVPGGTAFVEQFLRGIPCLGIKTAFYGYTPLEKIKSKSVDGFVDFLMNPPSASQLHDLQKEIHSVHGFSSVKRRFLGSFNEGFFFNNPMLSCYEDLNSKEKIPSDHVRLFFSKRLILIRFFLKACLARLSNIENKPPR